MSLMPAAYLERGVFAGVLAGVVYGLYVAIVANPLLEYLEAQAHEHAHAHDHAHAHAAESGHVVSEATTAVVSVGSGVLWSILLGGVFAMAFYLFEPALPGRRTGKVLVLAAAGFLTVSVAPWLVLPPTVPGAEATLGQEARLAIYGGMMVVGALVATAAVVGYRRTAPRSRALGAVVGAAPVLALVVIVPLATPTIVHYGEVPTDLVFAFRGLTVLSQAALWCLLAGTFSWLLGRAEPTDEYARVDGDRDPAPSA